MAPSRSRIAPWVWGVAVLLVAYIVTKTFFVESYRLKSGSMEPTLRGGNEYAETVLVRFDRSPDIERFDLVVAERAGQPDPVVKRVVGLPGESVSIVGGDLAIDGERLPWHAPRPTLIEVFDGSRMPVEESFYFGPDGPWTNSGEARELSEVVWEVDAREVARGSNAGMMLYSPDLRDSYFDPGGESHGGLNQVGDGVLELELRASGSGRLRLMLVEEGDTFDAVFEWGDAGATRLVLERWLADQPPSVLAEVRVDLAEDQWHRVRYRNIDNSLVVELLERDSTRTLLAHTYTGNQAYLGTVRGTDRSVGARVGLGAEGCRASFRDLHIARDLHFTDQGTFAVEAPLVLGLDEYFLLGDNSADSRDSRFWGPVRTSSILGSPLAVIRPWSRRRAVAGALPGPGPIVPLAPHPGSEIVSEGPTGSPHGDPQGHPDRE